MSNPADPFEFVKQLWGQMAVPGFGLTGNTGGAGTVPGMPMPSFDPKELEKRLAELKQVKQWLEMNLNMMGLQINTIEMQLAAMSGLKHASTKAFGGPAAQGLGGSQSSADTGAQPAPWMDPQAWMKFMQSQAAATQKAAQQAMQEGTKAGTEAVTKAMQDAVDSVARPASSDTVGAARRSATAVPRRAPRKKKS